MAESKTATFAINLDGNVADVAKKDSSELEQLRARIEASQRAVKDLSQSYRSLKGSSDEIAKAKTELKAKLESEKGTISQATLALVKQGTSLEKVTAEAKKNAAAQADLKAKLEAEKVAASKAALAQSEMTEGLSSFLQPAGAAVLAIAAIGTAIAAASVKLGEFIVKGADTLRSFGLVREAATGSAEDAAALGTQVDDLSHRVATSKEHLNELGSAIARNLSGGLSKASGQAIVDTFAAVSEAGAAMGDSVGSTLQGLVERGKMWNRFSLAPQDLDKTQLQFKEVAGSLAKNLGIGLEEAKARLFRGQVSLDQGAKALRDAVEARFGDVNAKKLLSLDVQLAKLHEHLVGITAGVLPVLDPILKGFNTLLSQFDETTSTGQTLKDIFTFIGQAISDVSPEVFDDLKVGVEEAVGAGLDMLLWLKGINEDLKDYGGFWGIATESMKAAVTVAEAAIAPFKWLAEAIGTYVHYASQLDSNAILAGSTDGGALVGDGLVAGIAASKTKVRDAAADLGAAAKEGYAGAVQIQSPSKVFERFGEQTGEGAVRGMGRRAGDVQDAADQMAPSPGGGGGGSGGGGSTSSMGPVIVNINLPESMAHAKATEVAKTLSAPGFLGQLTKALREAMVTQGVPTQSGAAP